ncbi:hypothetical protein WME95_45820 [Sorangium sp. So ce327]|uniref:hypothetical protein n=1 Tax=Sorangium sp. So ce327 TaxID=3133301 RepID=UPI003F613F36
MRIVFDESTLEQGDNASRSITGVLYFDFSGYPFPGERWSDFVVVIATWWLDALEKLERGVDHEAVLRFMDGPYWITLTRQDGNAALLRCTEDRRGAGVVHEEYIDLPDFAAQVRRTARQVASACHRSGIESSDVDALRRYLPN